jgi:hypothetical protein
MDTKDMKNYKTIKELVIDSYISKGGLPSYQQLTSLVKQFFPHSKWQESHYAWYKSQIRTGKISVSNEDSGAVIDNIDSGIENDMEDSLETRVSIERDLQDYLTHHLTELEPGLKLHQDGIEHQTDAGRIDILAVDNEGTLVVIEIKAGKAKDNALGQILGYIGCLCSKQENQKNIRGILVASDFDERVVYASKNLSNIKLSKYKLRFSFNETT